MLSLDNNVVYLLLTCFVWTSKTLPLKLYHIVVQTKHGNSKSNHIVVQAKHGNSKYTTLLSKQSIATVNIGIFIVAMLGLDNNVVYLLLPCLAWTTMLYIYCCHGWCGQQCGIFTVAMLGLNNNVIYLLLPCFVRTTINHIVVQTKHGNSKYTTLLSEQSMATVNILHCCSNQAWQQ
jgi:hypothetical protein